MFLFVQEREYAVNCQSVYQAIHGKYADSLQTKKNEHDKVRKNIRESWARDRKRSVTDALGLFSNFSYNLTHNICESC